MYLKERDRYVIEYLGDNNMSEREYSIYGFSIHIDCRCGRLHEFDDPKFPCYFKCPYSGEETWWTSAENALVSEPTWDLTYKMFIKNYKINILVEQGN